MTVNATFAAAQGAGNLNIVVVGWKDSTSNIASVTDTAGNTYSLAIGPTRGTGLSQSIYYAGNIRSGGNTITVTFDQPAAFVDLRILEYQGGYAEDVVAGASGSGSTANSGSVTTTTPSELIFGAGTVATSTKAAGSNFTARLLTVPDANIAEDRLASATGKNNATASIVSGAWVMQMVTFQAPVAGVAPPTTPNSLTGTPVSATQINLNWSVSTSSIGIANYVVQRCTGATCTNFAQIATPAGTTYNDSGRAANTSYNYRVRAVDAAGTPSTFSNAITATTFAAPTAPSSLAATAAGPTQINLSWGASTSAIGIANYVIQRCTNANCTNFAQIATPTGTTYSDTGLTANTSYNYRVRAVDTAGTLSAFSATATGTTLPLPTAPTNLTATAITATQIDLSWGASTSSIGITNYQLQRCTGATCTNFAQIATPIGTTYSDTGGAGNTVYNYRVRGVDTSGSLSAFSNTATSTTQTAPTTATPTFNPAAGTYNTPQQVTLADSTSGATIYYTTDNSTPTIPATGTTTQYVGTAIPVTATGTTIKAIASSAGNQNSAVGSGTYMLVAAQPTMSPAPGTYTSAQQVTISTVTPSSTIYYTTDNSTPTTSSPVYSGPITVTATTTVKAMAAATDFGNSTVASGAYTIGAPPAIAFVQVAAASPQSTTATVTVAFSSAQIAGDLNAVAVGWNDTAARVSTVRDTAGNTYQLAVGPTFGSGLAQAIYYASNIVGGSNTVTVTFTQAAAFPDVRIVEYRGVNALDVSAGAAGSGTGANSGSATTTVANELIFGADMVSTTTTGSGTSFSSRIITNPNSDLAEDRIVTTAGSYSATASLTSGNWVMQMATFNYLSAPVAAATPTFSPAPGTYPSSQAVTISDTTSGVTIYYTTNGTQPTTASAVYTGPISVSATTTINAMAAASGFSNSLVAIGAYTIQVPPTAPSNLTASAVSASQINLSWDASSSSIGIARYVVQRCQGAGCSNFAQVATPTVSTYSDTGLLSSTPYRYRVQAVDTAGGLSTFSNSAGATTQAAPAPTAPSNLGAVASSATQINLNWGASSSSNGIAYYSVQRCQGSDCSNFAPVVTPTGLTYNDTGLLSNTSYSYRVQAVDNGGTAGSFSNTASATTQVAQPPGPPGNLTASAMSASQINLSWTASTSNVGIADYVLQRCQGVGCSNFTQVATPAGTTYNDTGLNASTNYSYRVQAVDTQQTSGPFSNIASVTTQSGLNPVVLENQQTGNSNWQLGSFFGRDTGSDTIQQIRGYASAVSVNKGENITFYISVNVAQTYTIDIYRLGWYQGSGGRLMQHIGPLNGASQPACPMDSSTHLIQCSWNPSYTLTTQTSWTSGMYVAVLANSQGFYNYVVFVIRDDNRVAAILYQQGVNTDQAYNDWGGWGLYTSPRAYKVSFDRPEGGDGSGAFLQLGEVNLVRWLEKSGYDVAYSTTVDTHVDPTRLLNYRAVIIAGHNEYWSKAMYDAITAARDAGVHFAVMGANPIYWQVRFESSSSGVPNRVMVCYKDATLDPITDSNLKTVQWRDLNRAEQMFAGVMYTNQTNPTNNPYVVTNSSNWVYAGTGFKDGDSVPGLLGYEADRLFSEYPPPAAVSGTFRLLSHSPFKTFSNQADYGNSSIYQAPSGAWVFATGSIYWTWGLDNYYTNGYQLPYVDARIQRTMSNILNRFLGP